MASLQVRNLPEDIYNALYQLAQESHRSLTQQAIVTLELGLQRQLGSASDRRKSMLNTWEKTNQLTPQSWPDPVKILREDRKR
jgi:hypothetical protein